jgi:hypothetical protein
MQQEKVVRAMFMGHEIVVRNFWSVTRDACVTEATLAFDGVIVARTTEQLALKGILRATLIDGDNRHAVEALFGGIFTVRTKIVVDGRKVAGDLR